MAKAKQQRIFAHGEKVKIKKKSRLYDKDRKQEGAHPNELPPLDVDMTGVEGEVFAPSYENAWRGEVLVPIKLPNEAVIAVPEDRLERTEAPPPISVLRAEERAAYGDTGGLGAVSPETVKFWEEYFANKAKARELDELKRKGKV